MKLKLHQKRLEWFDFSNTSLINFYIDYLSVIIIGRLKQNCFQELLTTPDQPHTNLAKQTLVLNIGHSACA